MDLTVCDSCAYDQTDCPGAEAHCAAGHHCTWQDASCAASSNYTWLGPNGDHQDTCCVCKEKLA